MITALTVASGCVSERIVGGNEYEASKQDAIIVGTTTRTEVEDLLGTPKEFKIEVDGHECTLLSYSQISRRSVEFAFPGLFLPAFVHHRNSRSQSLDVEIVAGIVTGIRASEDALSTRVTLEAVSRIRSGTTTLQSLSDELGEPTGQAQLPSWFTGSGRPAPLGSVFVVLYRSSSLDNPRYDLVVYLDAEGTATGKDLIRVHRDEQGRQETISKRAGDW